MRGKVVARVPESLRCALLDLVPRMVWRDGATTAYGAAAATKHCEVANITGAELFTSREGAELTARLFAETVGSPGFASFAIPARLNAWRFNRYGRGGYYGAHVDESVSGDVRSDLSFTVLLQAAEKGGSLYVAGDDVSMLEGDVFVYPSTMGHGVTVVEEGERIAIVGWVQSQVRDHGRRALLGDVQRMIDNPNERDEVNLRALRNELLRRWAQ
jgi:PKHD-type hydroxylase